MRTIWSAKLAHQALQPCGGLQMESRGWICPHEDGMFLFQQQRQWLLALGVEQKLLPASVVRQETETRAEDLARRQGRAVGRKQMRELKDQVTDELLPRAVPRRRTTHGWIDAAKGWLAVDAAADAKSEQFEIEFALMTGELALLFADLAKALGGERADA
jgi:recombination associated protein RdgC